MKALFYSLLMMISFSSHANICSNPLEELLPELNAAGAEHLSSGEYKRKMKDIKKDRDGKYHVFIFSAKFCGVCRKLKSDLKNELPKIATEKVAQFEFYEIDASESSDVFHELRISTYPTVIVYKDGEQVHEQKGAPNDVTHWIDYMLFTYGSNIPDRLNANSSDLTAETIESNDGPEEQIKGEIIANDTTTEPAAPDAKVGTETSIETESGSSGKTITTKTVVKTRKGPDGKLVSTKTVTKTESKSWE